MTNNQLTKEWLQNRIADMESTRDDIPFGFDEDGNNELAAFKLALAAMGDEPHTDDELSNLLWYSQEATCHSDPNYYCEFQRLATPGFIAWIIRELQERRKAAMGSEPVTYIPVLYKGAELLSRSGLELIRDGASFATDLESACMAETLLAAAQPAPVVNEDLYKLANHIASSKSGLPDEWQDWADELETDIRRAAMLQDGNSPAQNQGWIPVAGAEKKPVGSFHIADQAVEAAPGPLRDFPGGYSHEEVSQLHADLVKSHTSKALSGERMNVAVKNANLAWIKGVIVSAAWFIQSTVEASHTHHTEK